MMRVYSPYRTVTVGVDEATSHYILLEMLLRVVTPLYVNAKDSCEKQELHVQVTEKDKAAVDTNLLNYRDEKEERNGN